MIQRKRESSRYTFREILPPVDTSQASESDYNPDKNTAQCETPDSVSDGVNSELETLSDLSRKHKKRPKCGGLEMKEYAQKRFQYIDSAFKFDRTDKWKCATCLEEIVAGTQVFCHELPHHKKCLITSKITNKGEQKPQ
jgi:hypothetical protein